MIIKIHRNNSGAVKLTILNAEGQAWNIPNTHTLKWTVKKSTAYPDEDIIIQKEIQGDGGNVYFVNLKGKDTNISVGLYKWDLKDTTQNLTLLEGDFVIQEVAFVGTTIDGIIEELQEITGNVEVGVFEGGSGTEDYNELYNKPKINNVTLIGNKTGENLGLADSDTVSLIQQEVDNLDELKADKTELPTKTSDLANDSGYITSEDIPNIPTKLSDLTNDSGFITETAIDSKDITTLNSAKAYTDTEIGGLDIPTKLSDLTNDLNVISESAINQKDTNTLNSAKSYVDTEIGDLDIPTKTSDLTNDSGYITSSSLPTKTSDLTNDSGYITSSDIPDIPTKTSDLTNDSGYITSSSLPTKTSDLTNDSGFLTSHQDISGKADTSYVNTQLATKQNNLTAGTGISITGNVISATGSGGTSDYTQLSNKPSINSITLTGNKSLSDLGIQHQLTAGTGISINNNVISVNLSNLDNQEF